MLSRYQLSGNKVLEIGIGPKLENRILNMTMFNNFNKYTIDIVNRQKCKDHKMIIGNVNKLPFQTKSMDITVCNATLEHDKYFWLTIKEIYRITKTIILIGVPGFWAGLKNVYQEHGYDYYRFNPLVMKEVFLYGCKKISIEKIENIIIGCGIII